MICTFKLYTCKVDVFTGTENIRKPCRLSCNEVALSVCYNELSPNSKLKQWLDKTLDCFELPEHDGNYNCDVIEEGTYSITITSNSTFSSNYHNINCTTYFCFTAGNFELYSCYYDYAKRNGENA